MSLLHKEERSSAGYGPSGCGIADGGSASAGIIDVRSGERMSLTVSAFGPSRPSWSLAFVDGPKRVLN
jgi:hypothetical protein